mmetsp:Transcript_14033/g.29936  ORF Transcript_14033/g.29936 Transcript_14033/m.29936 type:complete len:238 (+) Transcript_14033:975-1688(+)
MHLASVGTCTASICFPGPGTRSASSVQAQPCRRGASSAWRGRGGAGCWCLGAALCCRVRPASGPLAPLTTSTSWTSSLASGPVSTTASACLSQLPRPGDTLRLLLPMKASSSSAESKLISVFAMRTSSASTPQHFTGRCTKQTARGLLLEPWLPRLRLEAFSVCMGALTVLQVRLCPTPSTASTLRYALGGPMTAHKSTALLQRLALFLPWQQTEARSTSSGAPTRSLLLRLNYPTT